MKKVLVVHPQLEGIGGAELVSIRLMEWIGKALETEIDLLTLVPVNLNKLTSSGLSESTTEKIRLIKVDLPPFLRMPGVNPHLLRLAFLHRRAREIAGDYDICMSTYNELDFGKKGIQYVHHPSFASQSVLKQLNMLGGQNRLGKIPFANYVYRRAVEKTSGNSVDGFRKNITLVNSSFMKQVMERVYGIRGEVVYPAFLSDDWFKQRRDWDHRDFRFVSVGRIAADKNFTDLLDSYACLHREFPTAEYVIAGLSSDESYVKLLQRNAREKGVPLQILRNLPDQELRSLLNSSRFYVHGKINEHFGISIVEAAASGCLTMVHHSGSAEEIVNSPLLIFENSHDLVSKVKYLLDDAVRHKVLGGLRSRSKEFTLEKFYSRLKDYLLPMILSMKR